MFTFGIFSTHLPYIAFVLFYGFFFLAGIEKASAGDLGEGRQLIPAVLSVSADDVPDVGHHDPYSDNCSLGKPDYEQLLLYEQKDNLFYFTRTSFKIAEFRFLRFSRPPPFA